jgi:hypothetical protein
VFSLIPGIFLFMLPFLVSLMYESVSCVMEIPCDFVDEWVLCGLFSVLPMIVFAFLFGFMNVWIHVISRAILIKLGALPEPEPPPDWPFEKQQKKFYRRRLPYWLVIRCRRRVGNRPPKLHPSRVLLLLLAAINHNGYDSNDDALQLWNATMPNVIANELLRQYEASCNENAFQPWNDRVQQNVIPNELLSQFCRHADPTYYVRLLKELDGDIDHMTKSAQKAVERMNLFRLQVLGTRKDTTDELSFENMRLVWDTGASFGLTPFRDDFIDYQPCSLPVKDISKMNYVIGVGTVMYKFQAENGDVLYVPGIAYHLPSAEIRLLSPQSYHQRYGGKSEVLADRAIMHLPKQGKFAPQHDVTFPVEQNGSNLPILGGVICTDEERERIGPHLCSGIAKHTLSFFRSWYVEIEDFEYEFRQASVMCHPCVSDADNINLSSGQKELLLWHWKWGISMQRIQELMKPQRCVDTDGKKSLMPSVIRPKFASASTCPIPKCQDCELARAKRRNPKVMKQQAIKEKEGILSAGAMEPGDLVSMDQFVSKTGGRLLTGFGRERDGNRYHGGTIFNDAASGVIRVESQVSLGATETIGSKERFEEWLWNMALAEVKRYHSDNGVFVADEFREDCKSKDQKQTFSGVGAKHQNARAERAIQTIMYMARTFMLHAAIRWNERGVDDLSLWPFAVRHAAWLYNRLPNRVTGLTPLERLVGCVDDHRDILRAHVWGCPVYVLDPKLQDGKKIPKWNRRARMGQFLGFSEEHSSLVANVRHLRTGHVSQQYHVVFDDHFHTVHSDGENDAYTNAICDMLWENNREVYAEDEFDSEGELIYEVPPLHDVWNDDEDAVRDRKERLRSQRRRRERQLKRQVELIPTTVDDDSPSRNTRSTSLPDLVEVSDDDSAENDSQSPGDDVESEGDGYNDHPSMQNEEDEEGSARVERENDNEEPPEAPNIPNEIESDVPGPPPAPSPDPPPRLPNARRRNQRTTTRRSQRVRERDGISTRTRSRMNFVNMTEHEKSQLSKEIKQMHACSLSAKPPPIASRLSRKKLKYRQRLARRKEIGDMMLQMQSFGDTQNSEDGVPTVEEILNSPIAKFIHFAAQESGYEGGVKDLIVTWVHPLFLKAKSAASKEDNPNWWQAMNGPFAEDFWQAAVKEIETLESMGAWEVVDEEPGMNVIDSTWAFKIKRFPDGLIKKFKARFCARGDQQIENVDFFNTYSPVCQWSTVRLMLILEVLLDLKSKQADVTAAFLHASLDEDEKIYVRMPMGFRKKGKVLSLKRTLYGLRQSPRAFWRYMVDKMEKCGVSQSNLDPCLFVSDKVIAVIWVDDVLFWAHDESDIVELAQKLRAEGVDLEEEDDAAGFLGVRLERDPDTGMIEMKQTGLIDRCIEAMGLDIGQINSKWTPAEAKPLVKDEDGENARGDFNYASVVGMLLYLSGHSRPEISYAVNQCARYMFCPKRSHEEALKRIGRYLKATRDRGLIINPKLGDLKQGLKVDAYPDADFAGLYGHEKPSDPTCVKSRTGYCITVADCPVVWQSKLQTETALSTMEAEIVALAHCCRELFPIMDMVDSIGPAVGLPVEDTTMHVTIHEDNSGALVLAETIPPQYTPRSKHYHIKTIWFREQIRKRGIKLLKIDTLEQLGDIFTKGLARPLFEHLRKKLMGW